MSDLVERPGAIRALSLRTAARRSGSGCWLAGRLFALTGSWVKELDEPPVRVLLDAHSAQHAWHARLWAERLPVLADVDRAGLLRAPSGRCAAAFDVLDGLEGAVARLAGLYRVVIPRLLVHYRGWQTETTPETDGPVRRVLRFVQGDLAEQWIEGEEALQRLVLSGATVGSAARAVAAVEQTLVHGGGRLAQLSTRPRRP